MSALSYCYGLLSKCFIHGEALDPDAEDQSLKITLDEFVTQNNDEDYPSENYKLTFDKTAFQNIFQNYDGTLPEVKIVMAHVHDFGRYTVESYIGYKHDTATGDISFKLEDGYTPIFNLNHLNEYDGYNVQIHDIDYFLNNVGDQISLDHHWIMAVLVDPDSKQGLVPDYNFLEKYGIELN